MPTVFCNSKYPSNHQITISHLPPMLGDNRPCAEIVKIKRTPRSIPFITKHSIDYDDFVSRQGFNIARMHYCRMRPSHATTQQRLMILQNEPLLNISLVVSDALSSLRHVRADIAKDWTGDSIYRCSHAFDNTFPIIVAGLLNIDVDHSASFDEMLSGMAREFAAAFGVQIRDRNML
jgi:hypothetical protein